MKKLYRNILISCSLVTLAAVPLVASPLILNRHKSSKNILDKLNIIEGPSNETGWIEFKNYNRDKSNAQFALIQDHVLKNAYKVDSTPEGAKELEKMVSDLELWIKNSDEIQLFIAYWLRSVYASLSLYEITNRGQYLLGDKDRMNLISLKEKRLLLSSSDQQIMEPYNGAIIKMDGIIAKTNINELIDKTYELYSKVGKDND